MTAPRAQATPRPASTPVDAATSRRPRASVLLAFMITAILVIALFTPQVNTYNNQLTTQSTGPMGAQLAYDLTDRLGWRVQRRIAPLTTPPSPHVISAVLSPPQPIDGMEAHQLLEAVRAGGALLLVGVGGALGDSLGYGLGGPSSPIAPDSGLLSGCHDTTDPFSLAMELPQIVQSIVWRRPPASEPVVFASAERRDRPPLPTFVGISVGLGRVVLGGSGSLIRNDVLRRCSTGAAVAYVRALEYLRGATGAPAIVVFDEYHHDFGPHPGSFSAIATYAAETQSGHTLLQGVIAGLILLIAAAPRMISPQRPDRIPRRSALEQADALAHAYEAVGATRTVTARLLGGVRRRAGLSRGGPQLDDAGFLTMVAASRPAIRDDAEIVRRALSHTVPRRELARVARALQHIESALSLPITSSPSR